VAKQPAAGSTATVWEQCHELAEGFSPGVGWKVKKDMSDEKVCTTLCHKRYPLLEFVEQAR
jgi:hypothetical protein